MATVTAPLLPSEILERPVFGRLLFAQCWEDPRLDFEALSPRPEHTVLCVTSGGCNTLSLATLGPARIYAVDLNATQSALLELKIAGVRTLSYDEYLELLGVRPSARRWSLYQVAREALSRDGRGYWDGQRRTIAAGVLAAGRYERYLGAFRWLLRLIEGPRKLERLLGLDSLEAQRRFYEEEWNTALWRLFFRVFFSRTVLGLGGLDPAFFTYVDGGPGFGERFLARARHALVELPVRSNYFLAQICLGRYVEAQALPPYLERERWEALRAGVERIEIVTAELGAFLARQPDDSIDRFNFSNIFEWVSPGTFSALLCEAHRVGRPGARLCYRNLLVRRRHPASLNHLFEAEDALAARLYFYDRSFVYSHFEVAKVLKPSSHGGGA